MQSVIGDTERLPFRARRDLVIMSVPFKQELSYIVKDPVRLKYFRLQPVQAAVVKALEVQMGLAELEDRLRIEFPSVHVERQDLKQLVQDLYEKGLLASERVGQGYRMRQREGETRFKEFLKALSNPFFIRLPGWDPDAALAWAARWFGWCFSRAAVVAAFLFIAYAVLFAFARLDQIWLKLPTFQQFFAWPNLLYLWLTMAVTKVLHEFGHGIVCKRFGGECREMGIQLIVFGPTMYCDTSDSWTFPNKWHRIYVSAAGVYVELILAAGAILLWWSLKDGLLQNLCLNVFFVSTLATLAVNLNPLMRFDGYYIASDLFEIPNLQQKASQAMQQQLAKICFGIHMPPNPFLPRQGVGWFATYAIVSAVYRWMVMFGIVTFLYTILKPYRLEMVGLLLAAVMMGIRFFQIGKNWYKVFKMPRKRPLSRWRMAGSAAGVLTVLAILGWVPVPWYLEAPCFAQPVASREVHTRVEGTLDEILAMPGDYVEAGDVILRMTNRDLMDQLMILRPQVEGERAKQEAGRAREDFSAVVLAEQREASLRREIADLEDQLSRLTVRAPVSGWIVAPPSVPREPLTGVGKPLPRWAGTPLSERNRGAFLPIQTHLCTLAPTRDFEAVLLVRQDDFRHVQVGQRVRVVFEHRPGAVVTSHVVEAAERIQEICPPALSNKHGGVLPTVQSPDGSERLVENLIPVSADLSQFDPSQLKHSMRGTARVVIADYSVFGWMKRWLLSHLRFRM